MARKEMSEPEEEVNLWKGSLHLIAGLRPASVCWNSDLKTTGITLGREEKDMWSEFESEMISHPKGKGCLPAVCTLT